MCQSITRNTVHTNTTHKIYTSVFSLLHVSATYIDPHQVDKYRYRKRSATEEQFFCTTFPSVPIFFHLMLVNTYDRNMQWNIKTNVQSPCVVFVWTVLLIINLLKPTGYVMHHQFNIQQLYALPTLYLCVLYLSENKERLVPLTV